MQGEEKTDMSISSDKYKIEFRAYIKSKNQWFDPLRIGCDREKYSWLEYYKLFFSRLNHFKSTDIELIVDIKE